MLEDVAGWFAEAFGSTGDDLAVPDMVVRAAVVYVAALIMVRWGEKRFLGKSTAFDVILAVIFGSVVSRAITGQSPFLATLAAGFVLVVMHWLIAKLAFRSAFLGRAVKGDSRVLIRDGRIDWDAMRRSDVGENDLLAALRISGGVTDPVRVKEARLERSGDISVIAAETEPRILRARLEGNELSITLELR